MYQYCLIKSVMCLLRKKLLRSNMPDFETTLQSGMIFKRLLSKIYARLSIDVFAVDSSRIRWQKCTKREILREWQQSHALI